MTDDQAQPAPDPTCNCGHSVVQHHFHGTHGCRVCNCGSFSRPAPPTEREEREDVYEIVERTLGEHAHEFEIHGMGTLLDVLKARLRTHSPEEPTDMDHEERVWHWCLKPGGWMPWPQLACSYCGSRGPNIHTLTFGDDEPNWKPAHSPEEPADLAPKHDREAILNLIADDARRIEAGEPSVCAGCEKEIASRQHVYRCTECGLPFHLPCARVHFRDSADASPEEQDPVATIWADEVTVCSHTGDPGCLDCVEGLHDGMKDGQTEIFLHCSCGATDAYSGELVHDPDCFFADDIDPCLSPEERERHGWTVEHGVTCVVCPDCAFTFDADHEDDCLEGGYTCPNCGDLTSPDDIVCSTCGERRPRDPVGMRGRPEEPVATEVIESKRCLLVDADDVPDVVFVNGEVFHPIGQPLDSEEGER